MTNDNCTICDLWQGSSGEPPRFNPEELHRRISSFERTIKRRNLREYIAAVLVIGIFGFYTSVFPTLLLRVACGLIIAATVYVTYQLHRRASSRPVPADLGLQNCVDFQRSELARQRDALRAVWSWYLFPFVPGMVLFLFGLFRSTMQVAQQAIRPFPIGAALAAFGLVAACIATVFFFIGLLNRKAADNLQKQINDLDKLTRDSA